VTASVKRPMGAALGGALSALLFVLLLMVTSATAEPDWFGVATLVVALGAPVAIVLGWRFAPRLAESDGFRLIAWMGTSAMLLGLLEVLVVVVAGGLSAGPVVLFIALYAVGFGLAFGLVVLPFTIACAAVWYAAFLLIERWVAGGHAKGPGMAGASGAELLDRSSGSRPPWRVSHRC
jgi:hypothetical protein